MRVETLVWPDGKPRACPTKQGERGSALLIVFVFAAMVAIMLYMEMPVAVFEAQRQKEQLLVDRGSEYKHAVKLFVKKIGTYPASLDALENTNRMRFLRHRFKDPFTEKDDWRLLHAGPGGMITDSKVNPSATANPNAANGTTSANGPNNSNSWANNASTGTGFSSASANSDTNASSDGSQVVVQRVPQRPPAIQANGAPNTAAQAGGDVDENAKDLALPADQPNQLANTMTAGNAGNAPNGQPPLQAQPGGQAGSGANGNPPSTTETDMMRNLAANPNPRMPQQGTTSNTGQIMGGGIAGVASKAKGHSIKVVNDQTDYSLWEFYYDPTKDQTPGSGGGLQAGAVQGAQNSNGFGQNGTPQSGFGSSSFGQNTSGFGQSGFGQSTSGQSTANSGTATPSTGDTAVNQPQ